MGKHYRNEEILVVGGSGRSNLSLPGSLGNQMVDSQRTPETR